MDAGDALLEGTTVWRRYSAGTGARSWDSAIATGSYNYCGGGVIVVQVPKFKVDVLIGGAGSWGRAIATGSYNRNVMGVLCRRSGWLRVLMPEVGGQPP